MNFELAEEQRLLAESVDRFLSERYDFEERKRILRSPNGFSENLWRSLAEMGVMGLPIAEAHGGFAGGAVDLMSVMQAMGKALVVEPVLATLLAARLVERLGNAEQQRSVLPGVVDGSMRLAFAHIEQGARQHLEHTACTARASGSGWCLEGSKRVVIGAPQASIWVVLARSAGQPGEASGLSLFLVDPASPGIACTEYRTLDNQRAADIRFDQVMLPAQALLGAEGQALAAVQEAMDFATALACAEALGAMLYANEATLEYLKTRRQFGVPIGSFQALQHRMVDLFVTVEQVRSLVYLACSRVDTATDPRERARIVSAAKLKVSEACRQVSQESVQLHGGMGMTEEMKISHTFRRLTLLSQQFGDADFHLERYARLDR